MVEKIFEDVYTQYSGVQKLETLHEYLSKIPGSSNSKYVKCVVAKSGGFAVYNVVDILMSKSLTEDSASDEKKTVRLVYTADENSKTYTMKQFAKRCKQIFDLLKDKDISDVELQISEKGSDKGASFRFYYDNSTKFAILVRNTNVKGIEEFLNSCEEDLQTYISVPTTKRASKAVEVAKEKKPKKPNPHEGYVCIDKTDEFGHRITLWKKDPDYKSN